jgi:hypothetical protein
MGTGSSVPDVIKRLDRAASSESGEDEGGAGGQTVNAHGVGSGGNPVGGTRSKFLDAFLRVLRAADVGRLVADASLDQLDELNRVLCRPAVTELERKLAKTAKEAQPVVKILLRTSGDDHRHFKDGEENNDGGLYDGGIISEVLGPEGHRIVVHRAVSWALAASFYAPSSPPDGTGRDVIDTLHSLLCCGGFVHGLGIDVAAKHNKRNIGEDGEDGAGGFGAADSDGAGGFNGIDNESDDEVAFSDVALMPLSGADWGSYEQLPSQSALWVLRHGCLARLRTLGACAHFACAGVRSSCCCPAPPAAVLPPLVPRPPVPRPPSDQHTLV